MDQVSFLPSVLEAALKSILKAVVNKTVLRGAMRPFFRLAQLALRYPSPLRTLDMATASRPVNSLSPR